MLEEYGRVGRLVNREKEKRDGLKSSKKVNAPKNGDEAGLAEPAIPGICDEMRIISFILTKSKTISHIFYLFHTFRLFH